MTSSATHKHLFYSEMAKLLEAGFDIRKAAGVLMDTRLPAAQAALLKDLNQGLEAGQSITAAFGKDAATITELERNIIGAGERGGKLAPAFQHLADYFGMVASARREAVKSMIYPIIVLHLGIVVGSLTDVMQGASARTIFGALALTLIIVYMMAFVLVMAVLAALKKAKSSPSLDRLINRIPGVGQARNNMAMARFCKVYHSCILAGISMGETVQLASAASQSGAIREVGKKLLETVKDGNPLGPQMMASNAFPTAFARSYTTGEEAGTLDKDLASWSKRMQDSAEASANTLSVMIPKVLYFLVLGYIVWQILGFYGAHLNQIEELSG